MNKSWSDEYSPLYHEQYCDILKNSQALDWDNINVGETYIMFDDMNKPSLVRINEKNQDRIIFISIKEDLMSIWKNCSFENYKFYKYKKETATDIIQEAIDDNKDKNIILVSIGDRKNYVIIKKEFREKYKNIGIIKRMNPNGIHRVDINGSSVWWESSDNWTSTLSPDTKDDIIKMIENTLKEINVINKIVSLIIEVMSW